MVCLLTFRHARDEERESKTTKHNIKIKVIYHSVYTLLVLNFTILARKYFAGFYFHDFNRQT